MVTFRCEELTADHYSNSDVSVTTKDSTNASSPEWTPQGFPTFRHIPFKVFLYIEHGVTVVLHNTSLYRYTWSSVEFGCSR